MVGDIFIQLIRKLSVNYLGLLKITQNFFVKLAANVTPEETQIEHQKVVEGFKIVTEVRYLNLFSGYFPSPSFFVD